MKHLLPLFTGLFFLLSLAGNTFATTGNNFQNISYQTVSGANFHNTHHHKSHKVSSVDLTDEDNSQSLQNNFIAAIAMVAVFLPFLSKILFAEKFVDFGGFNIIFKPNLRRHLLLRRITV